MKLPFDKVYCLHLAEAEYRYVTSKYYFEQVGVLDQIEYWWTVKRPFDCNCIEYFPALKNVYYDNYVSKNSSVYAAVFNCAYEHYTIVKQAYLRGFNSILIFEDDVKIHVNKEQFENIMNNVPSDFDIIQFYDTDRWYRKQAYEIVDILENKDFTKFIKPPTNLDKYSTLCYALSRNGMKEVIDIHDRLGLAIADKIFNEIDMTKLNYYIPEYITISPLRCTDDASYILN